MCEILENNLEINTDDIITEIRAQYHTYNIICKYKIEERYALLFQLYVPIVYAVYIFFCKINKIRPFNRRTLSAPKIQSIFNK